jgi:hypothetical protein
VAVAQRGDRILVSFELPTRRADGEPLPGTPTIDVLRSTPGGRPELLRRFRPDAVAVGPGGAARVEVPVADLFAGLSADRVWLQVEVRAGEGKPSRPSEPVPVPRAEPPPAPTGLRAEDTRDGLRLSWDPPPPGGQDVGYNVYRRAAPGEPWGAPRNREPVREGEFLDADATFGAAYEYQVRAVAAGAVPVRESGPAEVGPVERRDRYPPGPPAAVRAVAGPDGMRVFWFPPPDADLAGFRLYRSSPESLEARLVAEVPRETLMFLDRDVVTGVAYTYRLTAIDGPGNESDPSEPATDVAQEPVPPPEPQP